MSGDGIALARTEPSGGSATNVNRAKGLLHGDDHHEAHEALFDHEATLEPPWPKAQGLQGSN